MTESRLHERVSEFCKAVSRLAEACAQPETSFMRDSVIQRFEFCWELAWNMLKARLLQLGVEATNPRDCFRAAVTAQILADGNAWTELQLMRNLTSHTYHEALAVDVYKHLRDEGGLLRFQELAGLSQGWLQGGA